MNGEYIVSTGNGSTNVEGNKGTNVQNLPIPLGNISDALLKINTCSSMSTTQYPLRGVEKLTLGAAFAKYFDFA